MLEYGVPVARSTLNEKGGKVKAMKIIRDGRKGRIAQGEVIPDVR